MISYANYGAAFVKVPLLMLACPAGKPFLTPGV
jgi:hypothetical protein